MVFVCGDIHGSLDIEKIFEWENEYNLNENDTLIILGDFGSVWYGNEKDDEELDWWNDKPYKVCFLDGNHENHIAINNYPVVELFGGHAHQIRDNVYHLMRGEIFTIENNTFFVMGGARSTDRHLRTLYKDWWPEEMPTKQEYDNALDNLEKVGFEVDYVLTHCTDSHTLWLIDKFFNNDELTKFLNFLKVQYRLKYKHHYFGHYHLDKQIKLKETAVYNKVIRVI